ncbi:amino acid ABC transporter permease [Tessaracoccus sp. MC1865]|uniref:amino acid ABC transporter permease n=1 Tax=unclassified Tessaracoccus TaxID=2635419 RepID=UPI00117E3A59|nr:MULTISPECIES: amino acid ABC transporter permease [unclassified Tessaracoccus]MBB1484475.1 amino acid ABC transporter permease [Tessaracoccus sp. MC1865]MCG6567087.1 glutamate ABC transporter permease [Tessaracoccus sp. ZS01]QTO38422.1 amino acid ABC transporter permease [Tessaracoccus sp. MC1865]
MLELIERFNFLGAVWLTLQLTLWGALLAFVLGTIVAIMRLTPVRALNFAGSVYVNVFRNTPLTLIVIAANLILWNQLGLQLASRESATYIIDTNIRLAIIALAVYHAAFVCEALRSGVNTIPVGQAEAARSIGLTFSQNLRHIILPQALRGAITPLGNVLIALTKNTTVVTAIGVAQVSHSMARMIEFRSDVIILIFGLVALTFVVLTLPMGLLTGWLSKKLAVRR